MSGNRLLDYAGTLYLDESKYRKISGGDMTYGCKWRLEKLFEEIMISGPVTIVVVKDRETSRHRKL